MEALLFTINAVVPGFILIGVGYLIKRIGWLDDAVVRQMNLLCFRLLLPAPLFKAAYSSSFTEMFDGRLMVMLALSFFLGIALAVPVAHLLTDSTAQRGAMVQGAFRSNMGMLGIAFAVSLVGEAGAAPAAILVAIGVPLSNLLGVIVLTAYGENGKERANVKSVTVSIVTNPMIIAGFAGISMSLAGIRFPSIIERPIFDVATASLPLAMMLLGAQLNFGRAVRDLRLIAATLAIKLVALPLLATLVAVRIGYKGPELCALYVAVATPVAISSVALADSMGSDSALAAELATFSTALSIITIFAGTFVLKYFSLI